MKNAWIVAVIIFLLVILLTVLVTLAVVKHSIKQKITTTATKGLLGLLRAYLNKKLDLGLKEDENEILQ